MVDGATETNHLIVVCGHGIWRGGPNNGHDEAEWLIENYKRGETPTFIEHIKAGLEALAQDSRAVLAFSGGPTWKETSLSEARSYANLAAANNYFGYISSEETVEAHPLSPITLSSLIILEEQALDSYYNVLFAIIVFWRKFQTWPEKLTIVSHAFKKARIVDAHCAAIGFPLENVNYIGINPPNLPPWLRAVQDLRISAASSEDNAVSGGNRDDKSAKEKADMMRGVAEVIGQWIEDPHGTGDALAGKRKSRNPWSVSQELFLSDDERARSGLETVFLVDGTEVLASTPTPGTAWARR